MAAGPPRTLVTARARIGIHHQIERGDVALEGNLKDFSLADMLRLLASGSKSGVLHVERDGEHGIACLREGRIAFASCGAIEPLSKRLVASGVISQKQLRQALGLQKIQKKEKAGRKLGQILVDEGYLDEPVLESFVADQIVDALFDMSRWEDGELRFEPDETCAGDDLGIAVAVDTVLADAGRRLELWNRIREKIPDMNTRFAMAPGPGKKSGEIHLKPKEWMLLCHMHGGKSVSDITKLTGYSDFETARILYGMYTSGLIRKVGAAGEPLPGE